MGLTNIKDLTHEMENILGKIRSREMVPTPDIVNILLKAADALKDLMDNILNSNEIDISKHVAALQAVLEAGDAQPQKSKAADETTAEPVASSNEAAPAESSQLHPDMLTLTLPDGSLHLSIETKKLAPLFEQSKFVYLVQMNVF